MKCDMGLRLEWQWRIQDIRKGGSSGRKAAHVGGSGGMLPQKNFDILDALR